MRRRRTRWGAPCLAIFALSLCACGNLDIVDHDPLLEFPEGNVAQAAERCDALPMGVESIEGLTTAWAINQIPVKDRDATFRVATSSLVLRLSDDDVSCEAQMEPEVLGCPRSWGVDVVLRTTEPTEGTHALAEYGQGYDLSTAYRVDGECTGDQQSGAFPSGELEIFAVTDECIVGRLIGTADTLTDAGAPIEGGFVALRCDNVGS